VAGKLGDRLGRRPLMLGGLTVFGIASLGAALAPSLAVLIGFRLLQAVAGAVALPNGIALLRDVVPVQRRAARFGLIGAAAGLAAATGPTVGGLVIGGAGWRAVFYLNAPIVALALTLAWRFVPHRDTDRPTPAAIDLLGSVLVCVLLGGLAGLLIEGRQSAGPALIAGSAVALAAIAALLLRHELSHPDPVLRPRLFTVRAFASATSGVALSNLSFYTTLIAAPIVLTDEFGWSSARTGLALTVLSAPTVVFGPLGGRLADRTGRRLPAVAGHVLATLGLLPLVLGADSSPGPILACLAVAGTGFGLASASLQTAAVEAVAPSEAGVASGLFSTSRYLGSIVGTVVLAAVLTSSDAGVSGFRDVAILVLCAAIAATAVSLGLPGKRARRAALEAPAI
jgi:DHA2 family methylenomycin A resistance protein-like MFS transporter